MKKIKITFITCLTMFFVGCQSNSSTTTDFAINKKENVTFVNIGETTTVADVINAPQFKGFGQFLFPTEDGMPQESMRVNHIDSLLPYHSHINTKTTVDVLNDMSKRRQEGESIFYDIYSDEEKREDPSKENTGLFFFKGKKNEPFGLISAGGGFSYVGSIHESFPHALELSKQGYNGFALQYRTGGAQVACEDLAKAIEFIFEHAKELEVSTEYYSLWGGSAGARMAAYLGSDGTRAFGAKDLPKPGAVIMQYTGHTEYTKNDPSTYACVGEDDGIADWKIMKNRIDHLKGAEVKTKFQKFSNLGHGFGLGIGTSAQGWIDEAINFWEQQME